MRKKSDGSDRGERLRSILQNSSSSEEALLKQATHYKHDGAHEIELQTCEEMIERRNEVCSEHD